MSGSVAGFCCTFRAGTEAGAEAGAALGDEVGLGAAVRAGAAVFAGDGAGDGVGRGAGAAVFAGEGTGVGRGAGAAVFAGDGTGVGVGRGARTGVFTGEAGLAGATVLSDATVFLAGAEGAAETRALEREGALAALRCGDSCSSWSTSWLCASTAGTAQAGVSFPVPGFR